MKFYNVTFFVGELEEAPHITLDFLSSNSTYSHVLKILDNDNMQSISIFMSVSRLKTLVESINTTYKSLMESANE